MIKLMMATNATKLSCVNGVWVWACHIAAQRTITCTAHHLHKKTGIHEHKHACKHEQNRKKLAGELLNNNVAVTH